MSSEDFYAILGIAPSSDRGAVQAAYRRLMRRYHPDGGTAPNTERAQRINRAYAVLSDPEQRRAYDETRARELNRSKPRPKRPPQRPEPNAAAPLKKATRTDDLPGVSESRLAWWLAGFYLMLVALLYLSQ